MAKDIQSACSFLEANQNRRFTMATWAERGIGWRR